MVELLSPVGDFECLKAAVQNGANAVYFGSNLFSARAFAKNFDSNELEQAINYAKLRGVKTHLTLNTLIKNDEFEDAFNVAKTAYILGIDAIIVQDLGLATTLIKAFPDLEIHASTQMTTANLEDVRQLENLGFKRAVLSRECSLSEIKHICQNSKIEIEAFVHGALCICYSGQCLFSSMVGGRSGNRGRCAQPCRLPYSLVSSNSTKESITTDSNEKLLDKGYLLSPKDLCSLEYLPKLIDAGVSSFKIEGRMKSPTYVAAVTRIYRKYIDLTYKYLKKEISNYIVEEKDKQDLLQVFNRGGFSSGHLQDEPNKAFIYPQKPNNMGIYLGKVIKYNKNKGLVTAKLENAISIGDRISFENENTKYTISELMLNNTNIKTAFSNYTVTFGRMKGNIKIGDKIYKLTDKKLSTEAISSCDKESFKTYLTCNLKLSSTAKISVNITCPGFNVSDTFIYDHIPDIAQNAPTTLSKIKEQFCKTQNTCFQFSCINVEMSEKLFIPTSILNDIRRKAIANIESKVTHSFKRTYNSKEIKISPFLTKTVVKDIPEKAILLNVVNLSFDYSKLKKVDKIYIPLKYFLDNQYLSTINILSNNSKIYIYMPVVIKDRFYDIIKKQVLNVIKNFHISGAVLSDMSSIRIFEKNISSNFEIIANYNFNIYNQITLKELEKFSFSKITLSPELNKMELSKMISQSTEIICYGKIPLMTMSYCFLGKANRCYKGCSHLCLENNKYFLNDRYNFNFRVIPDNSQTLTTIYNSRTLNIKVSNANSIRFDFLDETIEEMNFLVESISLFNC